ncbi:MAG: ArpU family phage packaging/lysis transcriptional regulator, partial [Limosilactobacillus mucosae]
MGALFNFTSVDDKATAANVRTFFRDDLSHLERLSGQSLRNALSSPRLSENGSNGNHAFNGVENAAINSIDAKNELSIVAEVLNQCSESTRKLITDRYINGLTVWQAASAIGYGRTRYMELFNAACNEFAERYAARGHELRIFQ